MDKKGKIVQYFHLFRIEISLALFLILGIFNTGSVTGKSISSINATNSEDNVTFKADGDTSDATKDAIVTRINCYRSCHSVSNLQRDTSIESGQTNGYASQLGQAGSLSHSDSQYGENLYAGPDPNDAVDAWYFECKGNYNYGSNSNPFACGHFTQLVWKASKSIGLGIAPMSEYGYVVVANFDPPGNYGGQYAANVLVPNGPCVATCKSQGTSSGGAGSGGGSNGNNGGNDMGDNSETTTMANNWWNNGGGGNNNNGMGGGNNNNNGGGGNNNGHWGHHHHHEGMFCGNGNNCDSGGHWTGGL